MRIGFIGLGTMGSRMVANLQKAGHELIVYDVRREAGQEALGRGARWAETPADAARQGEITLSSVPGPKEVEQIALGENGVIHGAQPGAIYVDVSTSSPTLIRHIHQVMGEKQIRVVDAPVSGGAAGAENATLQIMVGCEPELFEVVKPVLLGIGDKVSYIGEIGAGEIAKLVHNMIALTVQQVVAEGITLGMKAGVRPRSCWRRSAAAPTAAAAAASARASRTSSSSKPGTSPASPWRWPARTSASPPTSPPRWASPCPSPPWPNKTSSNASTAAGAAKT